MRILIVEDEKELCDTIAKSLHHAGYEVEMCIRDSASTMPASPRRTPNRTMMTPAASRMMHISDCFNCIFVFSLSFISFSFIAVVLFLLFCFCCFVSVVSFLLFRFFSFVSFRMHDKNTTSGVNSLLRLGNRIIFLFVSDLNIDTPMPKGRGFSVLPSQPCICKVLYKVPERSVRACPALP